ncbi:MAG: hypothetical protein PHW73_06075 [Atribacterota bacterium]|nr:hypothetical protein [Atribacterota bacterium]
MKPNVELECEILKAGFKKYEIAEMLGITDATFSRKLRKQLPRDEQQKILHIIQATERQGA